MKSHRGLNAVLACGEEGRAPVRPIPRTVVESWLKRRNGISRKLSERMVLFFDRINRIYMILVDGIRDSMWVSGGDEITLRKNNSAEINGLLFRSMHV